MATRPASLDLNTLDAALDSTSGGHRHSLGKRPLELLVQHPGGSMTRREATGMWLTADQVCVLYGGFLHQDSQCRVILTTHEDAERVSVEGRVASCRLSHGQWHEIVLRLTGKIDPRNFVECASRATGDDNRDRMDLTGTIALIEPEEAVTHLIAGLLKQTQVELVSVTTMEQADATIEWANVRLLLTGLDDDGQPDKLIGLARSKGFAGPIIELCPHDKMLDQAQGANHDIAGRLYKPFTHDALFELLWQHLATAPSSDASDSIESEFKDDPMMADMVRWYVSHVQSILNMMQRAVDTIDKTELVRHCRTISDTASAYGYASIGEAAHRAHRHVVETQAANVDDEPIRQLRELCSRMK